MATGQQGVKFYIPREEAEEFKRRVAAKDSTITAVLRRLIREYNAKEQEREQAEAAA